MLTNSRRSRRRGFTLVELLVVIGIIALLISILLPALNSVRQSAVTIKCSAALRELGNGFSMYAQDNRQFIPPVKINRYAIGNVFFDRALAADDFSNPQQLKVCSNAFWYNFLTRYIAGSPKNTTMSNKDPVGGTYLRKSVIWGCSTFRGYPSAATADNVVDGVNRNFTGYGMNNWPTNGLARPSLGVDQLGLAGDTSGGSLKEENIDPPPFPAAVGGVPNNRWYKVTAYTQASQRALLADSAWWSLESRASNAAGDNITSHNYEFNSGGMTGPVGSAVTNCDLFRHGKPPPVAVSGTAGYFAAGGGRALYNVLYADGHVQTENSRVTIFQATRMRFPQ